ncbi:hypothetical protein N1495_09250 [Streptococcus didelphis]|uniref:Uncharacterized protein n=1 Tax=Streptococcus didelphis TaxID=102886 RepID=A0ABY9LHH9_9STRE|nr:hypothetical protein [Streptococcus didelphis]WMB27566.1 hypothetical protein N1496_04990 [Streptococcus didelphis]WMB29458.1 hypothetical protein N1495_09250 [Streptococcus didelphis]
MIFILNYVFYDNTEADIEAKTYALRKGHMISADFEETITHEHALLSQAFDELEKNYKKDMQDLSEGQRK